MMSTTQPIGIPVRRAMPWLRTSHGIQAEPGLDQQGQAQAEARQPGVQPGQPQRQPGGPQAL